MDIGDYIYIIVLILVFVVSAIGKARKKKTKSAPQPTPQPSTEPVESTQQEDPNFQTILEEILKGEKAEEVIPEPEPIIVETPQQAPAEVSLDTAADYHFGTDEGIGNQSLHRDDSHYALPGEQEHSAIDFDLRKAIIYNAILTRPQY